jgi:PPK2 family polyphosphate:nucleotide phosphotransferase
MAKKHDSKRIIHQTHKFVDPFRITKGRNFRLRDFDPGETAHIKSAEEAEEMLADGVKVLSEMQERLYAQDLWSVLMIIQAMDAAGKDGVIKHVMSGINPQGCQVYSFKHPSDLELEHDFLWRTNRFLPERGRIGIFNRSYYEEVLIVKVHPELLNNQRIPPKLLTKRIWEQRYQSINDIERHLARNGVVICKFFLNLSKAEQRRRFLSRLDEPAKNWKFSSADIRERRFWDDYMKAYEEMIQNTSTPHAPWYVVPADNKWFSRLVVAGALIETIGALKADFPTVDAAKRKELAAARAELGRTK